MSQHDPFVPPIAVPAGSRSYRPITLDSLGIPSLPPAAGRAVTFSQVDAILWLPLAPRPFILPTPMALAIDRTPYASAPRGLSVSSGIPLLAQLVDAAQDPELQASPAVRESAKEVGKLLTRARAIDDAAATATSAAAGDPVLDQRCDRINKAFHLRLQAATLLEDGEEPERAADHLATLFPEGLAYTKAAYAAQDTVMQRMLRQLKEPELAASVEEIAGKKYLTAFKSVAKQYHAMVKAMGRVVETPVDQRSILVEMQDLVVQHASRILGELRDSDPKSVARTRALLAPIDNFRARNNSSGGPRPPAAPAPNGEAATPATDPTTTAG
jgi:hypothetical protein